MTDDLYFCDRGFRNLTVVDGKTNGLRVEESKTCLFLGLERAGNEVKWERRECHERLEDALKALGNIKPKAAIAMVSYFTGMGWCND